MSTEDLQAELERLRAENESLKKAKEAGVVLRQNIVGGENG